METKMMIYSESGTFLDTARMLSERLRVPYTIDKSELEAFISEAGTGIPSVPDDDSEKSSKEKPLYLKLDETGLSLTDGTLSLRGDFTANASRLKKSNLERELLVKCAKLKDLDHTPVIIDATAGMGEDSLLLAASGFNVILYEYDPVIASLLEDTLRRAAMDPFLKEIVSRMELHIESSIEAMKNLEHSPDVVLLDPMFPARTKSALVKKKFQLLQQLERPCSDENELFNAALQAKPRKIVIKRPLKGPFLAGIKPDYSLSGKAIRYDCILPETRKF
ncbi:16S rRNA (guanine1516-N2)-methyltransferase [Oribacterium sp. KHPX15]|uniref:class I SAM-dependent methyltransferase n=1 Tax=Oribacterium sp. KHPX15 TaxID=1855342 RepID=UPI00089482A8|nr:class I SAM-dependent methyltransferase [Oribacterium sp. KHPX15]SEA15167.1 16S rRNA (guanine1516-N2)-methyltransferase [Oribacterium sp. KHPX15]